MPVVMMTWVTPTASSPTIETCRMMISRRLELPRKLCPRRTQPSASKISAMPTSTPRMLASTGSRRVRAVLVRPGLSVITFIVRPAP